MKKIVLIILIMMLMPLNVIAKTSYSDKITPIEVAVFGYDYLNETDSLRIERLEKHLYGEKRKGNINSRLENIISDIGYSTSVEKKKEVVAHQQEDSTVDYPIVDAMEQEVFKTTYEKENIYSRLDRLEQRIFNQKTQGSLNERVERLAMSVTPAKKMNQMTSYDEKQLNEYYHRSGLETIDDNSVPFQLAVLEQDLLKGNFENDNIAVRLNRLEQKLFKRTFSSDSDISRLQRIMVAYDAKKDSYKYENNRKMQNMATASQIGGFLLMILAILL